VDGEAGGEQEFGDGGGLHPALALWNAGMIFGISGRWILLAVGIILWHSSRLSEVSLRCHIAPLLLVSHETFFLFVKLDKDLSYLLFRASDRVCSTFSWAMMSSVNRDSSLKC
jgi:hypothetical protein